MIDIDKVIVRSVINYCRDHAVVERAALEEDVTADCLSRTAMKPSPGHIWAALKDLHRVGNIEGMFDTEGKRFGVKRARHNVPRKTVRVEPEQDGFGFGEE